MSAASRHVLRTPRLTLRPLDASDIPAIVQGVGNYDVSKWLSVVPYPYSVSDAEEFLGLPEAASGRAWAICDGEGMQGVISIGDELGYWLARPAWGRGYLTEAGDAVLDVWFADPDHARLCSGYFLGNDRSGRVLEKLGFVETGRRRRAARALSQSVESVEMTLTRARWQERRAFRIETPRLVLREFRDGDVDEVHRIGQDPRVARNLMSVASPWPAEAARAWIEASRYRGRPGFRGAICLRSGAVIGGIGLGRAMGDAPPSCMIFLDPAQWSQGYGTEALGAFLGRMMPAFGLETIAADHFADNPASGRVLGKIGFVRVGEERGSSAARLEPAPVVVYRLERNELKVPA